MLQLVSSSATLVRRQIIEDFEAARLPRLEWPEWFEQQSKLHNLTVTDIKRIVFNHIDQLEAELERSKMTRAQKIAQSLGATTAEAIQVLKNGLRAEKIHFVQLTDEDGKRFVETRKTPDHDIRLKAATKILEIHGGFAPQEIQLSTSTELDRMTAGALQQALNAELIKSIQILQKGPPPVEEAEVIDVIPEPISEPQPDERVAGSLVRVTTKESRRGKSKTPPDLAGRDGAQSAGGPVLLPDDLHPDQGRAGAAGGGPVPPVPEEKVHPPPATIPPRPGRGRS